MRYEKVIERIRSGKMTYSELVKLKWNADEKYEKGDLDARYVLDAINNATPTDLIFFPWDFDLEQTQRAS